MFCSQFVEATQDAEALNPDDTGVGPVAEEAIDESEDILGRRVGLRYGFSRSGKSSNCPQQPCNSS